MAIKKNSQEDFFNGMKNSDKINLKDTKLYKYYDSTYKKDKNQMKFTKRQYTKILPLAACSRE